MKKYLGFKNWALTFVFTINFAVFATTGKTDGFEWDDNDSDEITITGYDINYGVDVIIPSEINSKPVTEIGDDAFYYCKSLTSVVIPNGVTNIGSGAFAYCSSLELIKIPNSMSNIGDRAFMVCYNLTSIVIPNSVTNIGSTAFYLCTSLTSIKIPNSVTHIDIGTFADCTSLTSIKIPNTVTHIANAAFVRCTSLTSIEIPSSVINIGINAFKECINLTSFTVSDENKIYSSENNVLFNKNKTTLISCYTASNTTNYSIPYSVINIDKEAFSYCRNLTSIIIPNTVTNIEEYTFYNCSNLTSITIPNSVTNIEKDAFVNCSNLASIKISSSVTHIGDRAFYKCNNLKSIKIPNSVTHIGDRSFARCTSLTSIKIPNSVTNIGEQAFADCSNLTSIIIPNSVTNIGEKAFFYCENLTTITIGNSLSNITNYFNDCHQLKNIFVTENNLNYSSLDGVLFNKEQTELIKFPAGSTKTTYSIPSSVTSIEKYAFSYCKNLISIKIPNSVSNIARGVFSNCTNLVSVIIPDNVSNIEERCFENCTSLTSIIIPNSVSNIGRSSFSNCTSLASIIIPSSVTNIGSWCFDNCTSLTSIIISENIETLGFKAFFNCSNLKSIKFMGDAPELLMHTHHILGTSLLSNYNISGGQPRHYTFDRTHHDFKIYFQEGKTGFTAPTWFGYPCEMKKIYHAADINKDWSISKEEVDRYFVFANSGFNKDFITMREKIRVTYLYNGGGKYKIKEGTIDGFDVEKTLYQPVSDEVNNISTVQTDTIYSVANSADSGEGSLRETIEYALDGDIIVFDEGIEEITLASEILIDKSITIDGNGITLINGDNQTRIFKIYNEDKEIDVTLIGIGLVYANNAKDELGGAIYNVNSNLIIKNSVLSNNQNSTEYGQGGGIYNSGYLNIINCKLLDNSATEENDIYSENSDVSIENEEEEE